MNRRSFILKTIQALCAAPFVRLSSDKKPPSILYGDGNLSHGNHHLYPLFRPYSGSKRIPFTVSGDIMFTLRDGRWIHT